MSNYNISLIILNYNSASDTIYCVNKILSFNKGYHIIIVDNCSSDDSVNRIKQEFSAKSVDIICTKKNNGYSAGNNVGIKYAVKKYGSPIVGVINPDVIIPNEMLIDNIASRLLDNDKYIIAGGIALNGEHVLNINNSCWCIPTKKELIFGHSLLYKRDSKKMNLTIKKHNIAIVDCVVGCFFLAKTKEFQDLGYLDENVFLYNEENILGIKCKQAGYQEIIAIDQFYIHNHKNNKKNYNSIKKKINATTNSYLSRKYLCSKFYDAKLLPALGMVELSNKIYLSLAFVKNRIFERQPTTRKI